MYLFVAGFLITVIVLLSGHNPTGMVDPLGVIAAIGMLAYITLARRR